MPFDRAAGVLLHPTALPGPYGIGDFGPAARTYLEWLASAGISWWQVLPLNPPGPGWSPYSGASAFAGNTALISPEGLLDDGLLDATDLAGLPVLSNTTVAYEEATALKDALLRRAFERFKSSPTKDELTRFRHNNAIWIEDYVTFASITRHHDDAPWWVWPPPLALRDEAALRQWRDEYADEMGFFAFGQFIFFRQWAALRSRAAGLGIRILGDLPIFVSRNSADVWAHRELFRLDDDGRPTVVAGVPPDYFSENGQLWGNPLYDWQLMASRGYRWWIDRVGANLRLVDALRLDHFRGFAASWEVPASATTARTGTWVPGPGRALFDAIRAELGDVQLVAEDLGLITEDVWALRDELGLPGMAVLQFAFSPQPRSLFLPHFHHRDLVVYSGTHDNNTAQGWYRDEAGAEVRDFVRRYCASDGAEVHWDLIRLALASVASLAIVPHQDIAGLGAEHRMNTPGIASGNWRFRITPSGLDAGLAKRLAELVWLYGRTPETATTG